MLVWRKGNIKKTVSESLCYSIVYCYNGGQWCEQFLQVGLLYWALKLLVLALCLLSTSVSSVFMVLYIYVCNVYIGWAKKRTVFGVT